ncbi:hypothetical protein GYH30_026653 [Glycine max]|nr:hypothetical protein GYH30_026653 [Glycine max]
MCSLCAFLNLFYFFRLAFQNRIEEAAIVNRLEWRLFDCFFVTNYMI